MPAHTLTADGDGGTRAGTALFTVQVTNAATGAYTVTLLDNVLHAGGPNDENDATAALTVLDHRRRRLDRHRHADHHLRRRCADGGSPTACRAAEWLLEFHFHLPSTLTLRFPTTTARMGELSCSYHLKWDIQRTTSHGTSIIYNVSPDGHT